MNLTKDRFFIDTNIIVYMFDRKENKKRERAIDITRKALESGKGIISYQVIQEFCNVALRKFETPLSIIECKTFITRFLYPMCDIFPGFELYNESLRIHDETGYSFYDSLIIASAVKGGCEMILSEDLHNKHVIRNELCIKNPFI